MDAELITLIHALDNLRARLLMRSRVDPANGARYGAAVDKLEDARLILVGSKHEGVVENSGQ